MSSAPTIYGIPNCDSVRKARKWFKDKGEDAVFHDLRKDGLTPDLVDNWVETVGLDILINKRGPSWRKLSDDDKAQAEAGEPSVFIANPTIIKRPVIAFAASTVVGVNEEAWAAGLSEEVR